MNPTLESYLNYKDIFVYTCPKCGMISSDLAANNDHLLYNKVKDSEEFRDVLDYSYLEDTHLLFCETHYKTVPSNIFDAYTFMYKNSLQKEKYLRLLNKSVEQKLLMLERYVMTVEEDQDEEDFENFKELKYFIQTNIEEYRKEFINEYLNFEDKNIFLHLIFIENLMYLNEVEEAKKQFNWLNTKIKLNSDLYKYFNDLIQRG